MYVRAVALCVVRKGDLVLVCQGYEPVRQRVIYRPLGGTIEFGEHSSQAALREAREELGVEVVNPRLLGVLENIFNFDPQRLIRRGVPGHEIVFVYEAEFADQSCYQREAWVEFDGRRNVVWKSLAEFQEGKAPLYPEGLLQLLIESGGATR
jgi:ADP-ribose pyrophosphatase YjhB (NUDIX family)